MYIFLLQHRIKGSFTAWLIVCYLSFTFRLLEPRDLFHFSGGGGVKASIMEYYRVSKQLKSLWKEMVCVISIVEWNQLHQV